MKRTALSALVLTLTSLSGAACGTASGGSPAPSAAAQLRLGYFANVTHAGAVYGVGSGTYQKALGSTRLKTQVFNAGPAAVEALFAGAVDAAYVGPSPAINAFVKSRGAVVLVAGATSGGVALVVTPGITSAAALKGKRIADPQTGGTQDVALRTYLADKGFHEDAQGAGDVTIVAQDNSTTLDLFEQGKIDGAWVPEPWASRLVLDGGGTVLVDEKSRWPKGQFVATNLLVKKSFLRAHPQTVKALLEGQVAADRQIAADPAKAQQVVNDQLKALTGKALKPKVIARAFSQITVTEDPLASTLQEVADHSFATGLVKKASLKGIYDLTLLRQVLGRDVGDAGLGQG